MINNLINNIPKGPQETQFHARGTSETHLPRSSALGCLANNVGQTTLSRHHRIFSEGIVRGHKAIPNIERNGFPKVLESRVSFFCFFHLMFEHDKNIKENM